MKEIKEKQESSAERAVLARCGYGESYGCKCLGCQYIRVEKKEVEE